MIDAEEKPFWLLAGTFGGSQAALFITACRLFPLLMSISFLEEILCSLLQHILEPSSAQALDKERFHHPDFPAHPQRVKSQNHKMRPSTLPILILSASLIHAQTVPQPFVTLFPSQNFPNLTTKLLETIPPLSQNPHSRRHLKLPPKHSR